MSITRHHTITAQPTVAPNALPAVSFDPALHGAPIFDGTMWWRVTATGRWVPANTQYETQAGHGLPALPATGFWPAYSDATGVHLAQSVAGLFAEFVVVDIPDANTYGFIEGGTLYTPSSTLTQRTTVYLDDATAGALVEAAPASWQALGRRSSANYTQIRIGTPQGTGEPSPRTYNTLGDRPSPATLTGGELVVVTNDGANNGAFVVLGAAGGTGTGYLAL